MPSTDEYWLKVEAAKEPLSEEDARELWRILNSTVFVRAVHGIVEQIQAAQEKLLKADLFSPAGVSAAQILQANIKASFHVIDTLLTQAAPPPPPSEKADEPSA